MRASEENNCAETDWVPSPRRNSSVTTGLFAPAPNTYWAQFQVQHAAQLCGKDVGSVVRVHAE
jgi:hypothetical protein